jgi:hypothetical protein
MGRHNREGRGTDQRGQEYVVSYQPDWLRQVKVSRNLENGRQSTKTLFRNPAEPEQEPGPRVRTRISAPGTNLDIEIGLTDPDRVVTRIIVETSIAGDGGDEAVAFTISDARDPED